MLVQDASKLQGEELELKVRPQKAVWERGGRGRLLYLHQGVLACLRKLLNR